MATLKFIGFPDGAKVSVDALQDAQTESATVDAWGDPVVRPTVAIRVTRAPVPEARHAPEGVKFEAFPSDFGFRDFGPQQDYDPEFHEIFYEWDFGDNRSPWTAPRLPDEFNAPSKGYGKRVGHVFVEPGEFMVTCTARQIVSLDPLQVLSAKTTTLVKVTDPEDIYGAQRTAVVALDGDFTGAPASNHRFTSTAAARNFVQTWRSTRGGIFRVLLKRGEDYRWDLDAKAFIAFDWDTSDSYDVAHVGSWGSGAKPLVPGIPVTTPSGKSLIVRGLDHTGDYDVNSDTFFHSGISEPTDPAAPTESAARFAVGWLTVVDTDISNVRIGLEIRGLSNILTSDSEWLVNQVFLDNVSITATGDYCMFVTDNNRDFFSLTGCAMRDDPYMLSEAVPPNPKAHSGIRTWRTGEWYLDGVDFFARSGWSAGQGWSDGLVPPAPQPCVRFTGQNLGEVITESNPAPNVDMFDILGSSYFTRCVFEGAGTILSRQISGFNGPQIMGNDIVENSLFLGGPQTRSIAFTASGGYTFRGNVVVTYDLGTEQAIGSFVGATPIYEPPKPGKQDAPLERLRAAPVQVYSNTLAVLYDPQVTQGSNPKENPRILSDTAKQEMDYALEENNVLYAPLAPLAEDRLVHTPDVTTIGLAPRYIGRRIPTLGPAPQAPFANGEDGIVIQPRLCFKAARGLMETPEAGDVPGLYIDQSRGAQRMLSGEWLREPFEPEITGDFSYQFSASLGSDESVTGIVTGLTVGKTYKLRVDVKRAQKDELYFGTGDLSVPDNRALTVDSEGTFFAAFTATETDLNLRAGPGGFDTRGDILIYETLDLALTLPTGALNLAASASEIQTAAATMGAWYIFKLTVSNHVSGALHLGTGDVSVEANRALDAIAGDGTYEGIIQATSADLSYAATAAGFEGDIALEVFEVPGNHLTPSAGPAFALGGDPGTMPIVDDTGTLEWSPTGTTYTVCHVRADKTYTWTRNVDAATAADILQQPDTLGFFATEQDIAADSDDYGRVADFLRSDHGVLQTQFATGDVLGWYKPTDPEEIPAVTSLPVVLRTIKGEVIEEQTASLIQGAHVDGGPINLSPISSFGASTSIGPAGEDIHTFLDSGTITLSQDATLHYELVGGGGGGGGQRGGGGGGGGVLTGNIALSAGTYNIAVGAGGVTRIEGVTQATNGGDTTAFGLTAFGGGHGGRPVASGGSGGGGAGFSAHLVGGLGTPGQGFAGGGAQGISFGGGGGGAGGAGRDGGAAGGDGGPGVASIVPGSSLLLGGGGGGFNGSGAGGSGGGGAGATGTGNLNEPGVDGLGGGAGANEGASSSGGPGGSGRATIWWVPA